MVSLICQCFAEKMSGNLLYICLAFVFWALPCHSEQASDTDVNRIRITSRNFGGPLYRITIPHGTSYTIVCPQTRQELNNPALPITENIQSYLDTVNHLSCQHPFPDFRTAQTPDRGITVLIMSARYAATAPVGICMDTFVCDTEMTSQCDRYIHHNCTLDARDPLELPGCQGRSLFVEYDCRPAPVMIN
ncbi:uncharacterized protein LOC129586520 [Paramacrobiotus metropolitanus]|uniref:uncharacterized protein LOC129586520 n=1 Tax=Paramacrobiotus metropolitanus TaxID=2943436 RepID=UPI00244645E3|nr:uncharacterized protein LOC129586520 [Paramacrobiotus metropolitanus]